MIYIGKTVNIKPTYEGCGSDAPMQGKVVYIHPDHRFYCAEFATLRGSFRECFPCPASMRPDRMPVLRRDRGYRHWPESRKTGVIK